MDAFVTKRPRAPAAIRAKLSGVSFRHRSSALAGLKGKDMAEAIQPFSILSEWIKVPGLDITHQPWAPKCGPVLTSPGPHAILLWQESFEPHVHMCIHIHVRIRIRKSIHMHIYICDPCLAGLPALGLITLPARHARTFVVGPHALGCSHG